MFRPEITASPLPTQMFELAAIAICLAKNQDKLKESKKFDNAHLFVPQKMDDITFAEGQFKINTHMFAGRVSRSGYARNRQWNMRLVEKFWTEEDGQSDASRTTYHFDWTNKEVLHAERTIAAPQEEEKIYNADRITVDEQLIDLDWFNVIHQMGTVTKPECATLIQDLKQFSQSSQAELHYNR